MSSHCSTGMYLTACCTFRAQSTRPLSQDSPLHMTCSSMLPRTSTSPVGTDHAHHKWHHQRLWGTLRGSWCYYCTPPCTSCSHFHPSSPLWPSPRTRKALLRSCKSRVRCMRRRSSQRGMQWKHSQQTTADPGLRSRPLRDGGHRTPLRCRCCRTLGTDHRSACCWR